MDRNAELHFGSVPSVNIPRCKLPKGHDHKCTFNTGDLIPIYYDDILPGTTVKMRMSELVRMMTPIAPVMDNAYLDTYFFFVPYRLLWKHWKNFMGENDTAPWVMPNNYEVPQVTCPSGGWAKGSLADHLGWPTGVIGNGWKASAFPFRAYVKIWNEWFRDENIQNPAYMSDGDSDTTGINKGANYDYVTDTECGAYPLKAAKLHDYFTSGLPNTQRGTSVSLPLGNAAPVRWSKDNVGDLKGATFTAQDEWDGHIAGMSNGTNGNWARSDVAGTLTLGAAKAMTLVTDLSEAVGSTVNQLRQAFALQKFYERAARGGSRYIETILAHFEVTNPDFRMQRPEYLGGKRIPINMNQVVQTDASGKSSWYDTTSSSWKTDDKTPQGNLAAYSATADSNEDLWTRSFSEHGCIMGLAVVRCQHSYQQGLNQMFSRKTMFDFYWPELANIAEQPIYNKEIYLQGTNKDDEAFAYQEAWASYRYMPDIICGELRSNYAQSLDIWHYGDDYSALPTLSPEWISEPESNMARTLAVQSHDQFFGDFYFKPIYTLPMPLYSVPGLIDHH